MILILTGDKQGAQQVQVRTTAPRFLPLALSVVEAWLGLAWLRALCSIMSYLPTDSFKSFKFSLLKKKSPESIKGLLKLLKSVSDMKDVTHLSVP